jgi:hypothetical protein
MTPIDPSDNTLAPLAAGEWHPLVDPLGSIAERMVARMDDPGDEQLRQELYRVLYATVSYAYSASFSADARYPDFGPVFNKVHNFWATNPDDTYTTTPVEGGGVYRISGFRGSVRIVKFSLGGGRMFPYGEGRKPGAILVDYDIDGLKIGDDGSFDVLLSAERPAGYGGDWWALPAEATYILIRQIAYDWIQEVDGRFTIDRLDTPAIKPRASGDHTRAQLAKIPAWVENWTNFMFDFYQNMYHSKALVNKAIVQGFDDLGGITTQQYVEGLFDLAPGEALIWETEIPKRCRYWSIQLIDMAWCAIDHMNRQGCLNAHTSHTDSDGKLRYVISAADPGVPNWLDTAGYRRGVMFGRWMESDSAPGPTITKVKLAELRRHLPSDTPVVTPEQRDAAIRLRRKGAQLRRRW